jgi:hypothetical protein
MNNELLFNNRELKERSQDTAGEIIFIRVRQLDCPAMEKNKIIPKKKKCA